MFKSSYLALFLVMITCTASVYSMNYVPNICKKTSFWVTLGLATAFSASIYGLNYWQDSTNRSFYDAVFANDIVQVRTLLKQEEIDFRRRAKDGKNLLHYAVMNNQLEIALIFAGDLDMLNQEDKKGNAPLYYAVKSKNSQMCKMLRAKGANRYCCMQFTQEFEEELFALLS